MGLTRPGVSSLAGGQSRPQAQQACPYGLSAAAWICRRVEDGFWVGAHTSVPNNNRPSRPVGCPLPSAIRS